MPMHERICTTGASVAASVPGGGVKLEVEGAASGDSSPRRASVWAQPQGAAHEISASSRQTGMVRHFRRSIVELPRVDMGGEEKALREAMCSDAAARGFISLASRIDYSGRSLFSRAIHRAARAHPFAVNAARMRREELVGELRRTRTIALEQERAHAQDRALGLKSAVGELRVVGIERARRVVRRAGAELRLDGVEELDLALD